ncbi:MAG: hypothetical protein LIP28_09370, partial [Deltaproteobacteria bacterium]|nr:hypothetical protein [Deltaproteobacteria bacterium]
ITEPQLEEGFPEAVVTLVRKGREYVPDAFDVRRHPDTGMFRIPFWAGSAGEAHFAFAAADGETIYTLVTSATQGRNFLQFPQFMAPDGNVLTLTMRLNGKTYSLPVRLH